MSSGQEEYCLHVLYVSSHWWVDHLLLNNSKVLLIWSLCRCGEKVSFGDFFPFMEGGVRQCSFKALARPGRSSDRPPCQSPFSVPARVCRESVP